MAKQFKDFHKDAKDLLTKNYPAAGTWKIEGKIKPVDEVITVNPNADASGINVDIEYNVKKHNLKTKTNFTSTGLIKPKVTYDINKDQKVEVGLSRLSADAEITATYEGTFPNGLVVEDTFTTKSGVLNVAYPIGAFNVGASIACAYGKSFALKSWSAGARWADNGYVVSATTVGLQTYTTGVTFPLTVGDYKFKWAAVVDCGHNKFTGTVGFEVPVCCFTLRTKIANSGEVAIAFIRKFNSQWTSAISFTSKDCCKVGVHLTRE